MLTRRSFLRASGVLAGSAAGLGIYTWRIEPHWVEFVHRPLPVRNLPASLAGRSLVQMSDLHVGPRVDDEYVVSVFERVSALAPDIVVMTGDFISHHAEVFPQASAVYQHVPNGKLATLAVLGNHDYGRNWSYAEVAEQMVAVARGVGIKVLRNAIADVEGLQVGGIDDLWGTQFDPKAVLSRMDPGRAGIVLSHNPDTVDLPVWRNYEGWILSGHTHGGQCRPPFLPPPILPVRNPRYIAGEVELSGNRRLYINRGVGHLTPVRFNVRPEVTVFELQRA